MTQREALVIRASPKGIVIARSVEVDLFFSSEGTSNRTGRRTDSRTGDDRTADNGRPDRPDRSTNATALKRPGARVRTTRRKGKRGNAKKDLGGNLHDCSSSLVCLFTIAEIGHPEPQK
jgi:hypothetical protein